MIHRDVLSFGLLATGKAVGVAAGLLLSVTVGRLLGPAGLGSWSLLLAAGAFVNSALISWTHAPTVRYGCEEWAEEGTLTRTLSARFPLVLGSIGAALFLLIMQPFGWLEDGFGVPSGAWLIIAGYAASLWLAAEVQALLQATDRLQLQAFVQPGIGIVSIVALVVSHNRGASDAYQLLGAVVLSTIGVSAAIWFWTLRSVRSRLVQPSRETVGRYLRYGTPLLLGYSVGYLSDWGDHVLLGLLTSREAVGQFGLSYQAFVTLTSAASVLTTIALPRLVVRATLKWSAAKEYLEVIAPTVFALWTPLALLAVAVLPGTISLLAGPEFSASSLPLMILCAVVPAQAVVNLYTVLFNLQERLKRIFYYTAGMAVLNLTLSFMLIPDFGAAGAATATAASYFFVQMMYLWDQHRYLSQGAGRILPVWIVAIIAGILQIFVGIGLPWRILWLVSSCVVIAWVARRTSAVNGPLLNRLLDGDLAPLGAVIQRVFVAEVRQTA